MNERIFIRPPRAPWGPLDSSLMNKKRTKVFTLLFFKKDIWWYKVLQGAPCWFLPWALTGALTRALTRWPPLAAAEHCWLPLGAVVHCWVPLGAAGHICANFATCSWEPLTMLNPQFVAGEHGLFGGHKSEDIRTFCFRFYYLHK